jgi:thiamine biosynthesis lipoprotein
MKRIARRRWLPPLLALLCLASCRSSHRPTKTNPPLSRHTAERVALGARFRLTFYAPDAGSAGAAAAAALGRLSEVDKVLNLERPDSEISALNRAGEGVPTKVSDDLFAVLQHGLRLAEATRGAYDPTSGPYTELWRRTAAAGRAPTVAELEETKLRVGWDKLRLNAIERTATFTVPGMRIDPAGLARGYAVDQVFRNLRAHGCDRAKVDAGNVILVGTPPPGRQGWPTVIHGATGPKGTPSMPLTNMAAAFSSNMRFPASLGMPPPARLIDPVSGRALDGRVPAAVLARSGATAESVAAAAVVLGPTGVQTLAAAEGGARIRFGTGPVAGSSRRKAR